MSALQEEAVTPTGLFPGPAFALEDEEAVAPTGLFPGPVFADDAPADAQALAAAGDDPEVPEAAPPPDLRVPITPAELFRIAAVTARAHSGDGGYSAVEDGGPGTGLRFGLVLAAQATGGLGRVLTLMRQRDAAQFDAIFGPAAAELLTVTAAATPGERLAMVGGAPLTDPVWQTRFAAAGGLPAFAPAQNEYAVEGLVRPLVEILLGLGLDRDRGLAMAVDRAIVSGPDEALAWVLQAAGPLQTAAQRQAALRALGHADLGAFQAATGRTPTGRLDAHTYAELVAALRAAALPAPDTVMLEAKLVAAATGDVADRLCYLRESSALTDARYRA